MAQVSSSFPHSFFFCIILTITISKDIVAPAVHAQCLEDQKTLLLDLKSELKFDPDYSRKLARWNQTHDCCSWDGVECDGAGHVITLQLDDEFISGGLNESSSLFRLRYLEKLNLAYNFFTTQKIPNYILMVWIYFRCRE
ncbi:hypothetical protein C2S51_029776 [Perilla frutescens var. frutescens]|nr:hypothetical protein C2S51_029776 [Perilla frutescens var. frutescens]